MKRRTFLATCLAVALTGACSQGIDFRKVYAHKGKTYELLARESTDGRNSQNRFEVVELLPGGGRKPVELTFGEENPPRDSLYAEIRQNGTPTTVE
jgi:hypothetical protein